MKKALILSTFFIFTVACTSNKSADETRKESADYIDLTSDDNKETIKDYWMVTKRQNPQYPIIAARDGVSGCVEFIVGIDRDGTAGGYKVQKSFPEGVFDDYAAEALRQWKWKASKHNTDKAAVLTIIQLDFMVNGSYNKSQAEKACGFGHM
jgi:TonB family protein